MNPHQPPARPRNNGLERSAQERRVVRNRRIVMVVILLVGVGIVVWDFLRPARPAPAKPAPSSNGQSR